MKADIRQWAKACVPCQKAKVGRHTRSPFGSFPSPDERFAHVHVDITGPLPLCEGQSYLLTCVGRFSCWCEAFPMPDITAYTTAKTFVAGWVSRFGVPAVITTDRGKQLDSDLFNQLMKLLGSKITKNTAYHPEANWLVEQFHRSLKPALRARMNQSNWLEHLPLILLRLRAAVKDDLKCLSAEMVYGTTLRLPGKIFSAISAKTFGHDFVCGSAYIKDDKLGIQFEPKLLQTYTHVFVRDLAKTHTLQPSYWGPFKVLKRHPKVFEVEMKKFHRILPWTEWNLLLWMLHGLAWTLQGPPPQPPPPNGINETVTKSGRHVRWPKYLLS